MASDLLFALLIGLYQISVEGVTLWRLLVEAEALLPVFCFWGGHALLVCYVAWCFQQRFNLTLAALIGLAIAMLAVGRLYLGLLLLPWAFLTDGPLQERVGIIKNALFLLAGSWCQLWGGTKGFRQACAYFRSARPQS